MLSIASLSAREASSLDHAKEAVAACSKNASYAAEQLVESVKANGDAYDAVAIGEVKGRKGEVVLVTGSVDAYTDAKMFELDYTCEYNHNDPNGPSTRVTDIKTR